MIEEPPEPSRKSDSPNGERFSMPARINPRMLSPLFSKKSASSVATVAFTTQSEISFSGTGRRSPPNSSTNSWSSTPLRS